MTLVYRIERSKEVSLTLFEQPRRMIVVRLRQYLLDVPLLDREDDVVQRACVELLISAVSFTV